MSMRVGAEDAAPKSPVEIVRSLYALQDQVVLGSRAAHAALPTLSGEIADRLLQADPDVWKDAKNAAAVVTYMLSGGQPRVARKILEIDNCPASEKKLLEGALAYVEGRSAKALQILGSYDPKAFPGPLGAHLALVQAQLFAKTDARKSIQLLDIARVLAPGTLVEEAALRREIFLFDEMNNIDRFVTLSSQYERRFHASVYADNFRQRLATALVHLGLTSDLETLARLEKFLNELEPGEQLKLYLVLARAALVEGKPAVARYAAERAEEKSKGKSSEAMRAKLYNAVASILTHDYDSGVAALESVDRAQLSKSDAELKDAASAIALEIHKWPADAAKLAESVKQDSAPDARMTASAAVIDLAQKSLAATDALLKESMP